MAKIESTCSYWEEFFRTHPDPTELRSLVSSDPSLIKIFNFSSDPCIWAGLRQYPFKEKAEELKNISKEDLECLDKKRFQEENNLEWLDYLGKLFDMVSSTVRLKKALDEWNEKNGKISSDDQILKKIEKVFKKAISVDQIIVYKEENGVKVTVQRHGRFFPIRLVKVVLRENEANGSREWEGQEHFSHPPTEVEIRKSLSGWDRFSGSNIGKYGGGVSGVCFGWTQGANYKINLYYKGILLGSFDFPIAQRYRPLLEKKVREVRQKSEAIWKDENFLGTKEELHHIAVEKLFEKARRYDESRPVDPKGYFAGSFEHFSDEILEDISTEAIDIKCDEICMGQKELEGNIPCEYETLMGYCADPKKRKVVKPDLSPSTERFDQSNFGPESDEEQKVNLFLATYNKDGDIYSEEKQFVDHITLEEIYESDPELARIMKKESDGNALSSNERKFKERAIKKLKKTYGKK